jgi:hypothetical protein
MVSSRFMVLIGLSLMTGNCGGPSLSEEQRAEVVGIAEDHADAAASGVASIGDTSELERKIKQLEREIEFVKKQEKLTYEYAKNVSTELDRLRDHYNQHLQNHHGAR